MQVRDYKRLVSRLLRRNISKPLCAIPHDVERPLSCHEWCAFLFAPHCRIQDRKVTETGNPCSGDRCAKRLSGRFFRMYATSWINYLTVSLVGDEYRCGCKDMVLWDCTWNFGNLVCRFVIEGFMKKKK